jgi:S-DNA-T family DNA segregation ATPase FtsK/SpoIIIE
MESMIFEILTTSLMGGIAFKAFMKKNGMTSNDSAKIQRILSLSGLNVKDGKDTLTTQLIRKKEHSWGMEYKYRIPLGRSFNDYVNKQETLQDGLNNRRKKITINDLKTLQFDENIIDNIKAIWNNKLTERKELEMSFDGLLILRVYNEPLPTQVDFRVSDGWKFNVGQIRENNQIIKHDFERIPHLVIGGATRYGKSNLINSIMTSLILQKPNDVKFHLVDLKGGIELGDYENIKQTVSIAYEPSQALETLKNACDAMREVQMTLKRLGKKKVQDAGIKTRHFVVIDEVGELNPSEGVGKEDKLLKQQCQTYMSQIARLGAGLGFRLILATQYPVGDTIPRQCKANADGKISFRVQSEIASRVALDEGGAEKLPQIVGRAIYQTGDGRRTLQTPLVTAETICQTIAPHIHIREVEQIAETIEPTPRKNIVTFEEV